MIQTLDTSQQRYKISNIQIRIIQVLPIKSYTFMTKNEQKTLTQKLRVQVLQNIFKKCMKNHVNTYISNSHYTHKKGVTYSNQSQFTNLEQEYFNLELQQLSTTQFLQKYNQDTPNQEYQYLNIKLRQYNCILKKFIAKGGEGDIYEGTFYENKNIQQVIFKIMRDQSNKDLENEVKIMKRFNHYINIIQFIKWIKINNKIDVIILQKCKFSLLEELKGIMSNNQPFSEQQLKQILIDLLDGLIQLRILKIIHLDIKPSNILVSLEGNYLYNDFGISSQVKKGEAIKVKGYTKNYASQEQINMSKDINYLSDVFSLGITFQQVIGIYKLINKDNYNLELISSLELIIENNMISDIQLNRCDCYNLHKLFLEVFMRQKDNQLFKTKYYEKIDQMIKIKMFNNNNNQKDIPYTQDLYIYYLKIALYLNQTMKNNYQNQSDLFYEISASYHLIGHFKKSIKYSLLSLNISKQFFNRVNPTILMLLSNNYKKLGDVDIALAYSLESLEMSKQLFQGDHPQTAKSLNFLGIIYRSLHDLRNSLKYSLQSIKMYFNLYKQSHPDIALSLNNLGNICYQFGDTNYALQCTLQSLKIYQQLFLGEHPNKEQYLKNISKIYLQLGDSKNGLKYALKSLEIGKQILNGDHPSIASVLNNTGLNFSAIGDIINGLKYAFQPLEMNQTFFIRDNPQNASLLNNFRKLSNEVGDSKNDLNTIQSIEMYKNIFKGDHPGISSSLNKSGKKFSMIGYSKFSLKQVLENVLLNLEKQKDKISPKFISLQSHLLTTYLNLITSQAIQQRLHRHYQIFRKFNLYFITGALMVSSFPVSIIMFCQQLITLQ